MNTTHHSPSVTTPLAPRGAISRITDSNPAVELDTILSTILPDCMFAAGQAIGMRKDVDGDAMAFLGDHFRAKFLSAIQAFGNRWEQDRENVTGVAMLLGERAVRHAGERASIDLESIRKAAADVERHCTLHARRAARAAGPGTEGAQARIAGYWCTEGRP